MAPLFRAQVAVCPGGLHIECSERIETAQRRLLPMINMDTQLLPKKVIWNARSRKNVIGGTCRESFFGNKAGSTARFVTTISAAVGRPHALFNVCNQEGH